MKSLNVLVAALAGLSSAGFVMCIVLLFSSCKGASAPTGADVEAGAPIAEDICQLIENKTGSTVLETICASLPEIALIAETILAMRVDSGAPTSSEACTQVPKTNPPLCATPRELHGAIHAVMMQRRARLLVDAGLQ